MTGDGVSRHRRHTVLAAVSCAMIAGWLAATEAFWFDELLTRDRAVNGLDRVVEGNGSGYFAFLRIWTSLTGASRIALRLPSVAAVVATVPLVALAARRRYDGRTAVAAAWLVALHPFTLRYGSEARGYAFVMLAAAAALVLVEDCHEHDRWRDWAFLGLTGAAGAWCHIGAGWILAVGATRARSPRFLVAWAVGGVTLVPLIGVTTILVATAAGSFLLVTTAR